MKRLVGFILFIALLIVLFVLFANHKKNYELSYEKDGFTIKEEFKKQGNNYYFYIEQDDKTYAFLLKHKYSNRRKIVNKIEVSENAGYSCLRIDVFGEVLPYVCLNDSKYYDGYYTGVINRKESNLINTVNQIAVYDETLDYYLWNGYGITNILEKKDYNFLEKESYDNKLSYQSGNYLIIADYDATRDFNKFFVFNFKTKKITEFSFDYNISFNSYFMGDYDNKVYLFDKKNKIQYCINVEKSKIDIVSDDDGAVIYQNKWDTIGLNKLVYNDIYFENTNLINYALEDDKIYYHYMDLNQKVLIDEGDISTLIATSNNELYYLKKDALYKYNVNEGPTLLLSYFEWNFSYSNKIFIFN